MAILIFLDPIILRGENVVNAVPPPPVPRQLQAVLLSMLTLSRSAVPRFEGCWHVVLDFVFLLVGKLRIVSESPKGLVPVSLELRFWSCFRLPAHPVNCSQAPPRILGGFPTPHSCFCSLAHILQSVYNALLKEDVNPNTWGLKEEKAGLWLEISLHYTVRPFTKH